MTTVRKFQAHVPRPKSDGNGVWWHRIGSAVENDKGQVTIYFDSLPFPDIEGTVKVMLFEPKEDGKLQERRGPAPRSKPKPKDDETDDEIPF